jgi:molybdate transport system permease protein
VTQTISIDVYDEVQGLDYAVAARTSALLLVFSFITLALVYGLNRRSSIWWSSPRNA